MVDSDAKLVDKILRRDKRALSLFYRTYAPALRRYIGGKIANHLDAEEILQDSLFAFLEAIRDFGGRSSIKTFLFSITNHKIIDFYRRKKMKHIVFSKLPQLSELISPLLNPEEVLDEAQFKEKVARALSRLIPRYRQIITLKYLDNISVTDIARELAISFKSAESRLFRARKAFVELFLSI
ncbi:hypothetical protein A3A79_02775 [Candidatus Gottesmanbacteria bacterium RIFCSPLOWO2_01_FULL_43_11b]|uniref:RNA polymerase sigma factor n=1 Tax=Candidatus Gottesmanbacteria bacterium RIFCSPLOWO2_01_FULL_43_11b TaxID=1798392 RepID=A0A1F6AHM0_9BACT|nr:MAG: hypothetical protein A3A79_02775 [Candidatus Gottesmanbacteria bacterium RIFCSPLOWO2_01_FULL_43_11b]